MLQFDILHDVRLRDSAAWREGCLDCEIQRRQWEWVAGLGLSAERVHGDEGATAAGGRGALGPVLCTPLHDVHHLFLRDRGVLRPHGERKVHEVTSS